MEDNELMDMPAAAREQVEKAREIASQLAASEQDDETARNTARDEESEAAEYNDSAARGKIDPEDYKSRFAELRNKRDERVQDLLEKEKQREAELQARAQRIAELEAKLVQSPEGKYIIPAALVDELGEESARTLEESLNGFLGSKLQALQQNVDTVGRSILDTQKSEVMAGQRTMQADRVNRVFDAAGQLLKVDMAKLDNDPKFAQFMTSTFDKYSGKSLAALYQAAFKAGDAGRMADLSRHFVENKQRPAHADKVMPDESYSGDAQRTQDAQVKPWTRQAISDFYVKLGKGAYTPDQAASIKRNIQAAVKAHQVYD
jgi:hypothetical protein